MNSMMDLHSPWDSFIVFGAFNARAGYELCNWYTLFVNFS